jgi:Indigoidine synthase A like protein
VPATIAVLGGVPHVGLTQQQLEHIAQRGLAVRCSSQQVLACLTVSCKPRPSACTAPRRAAFGSQQRMAPAVLLTPAGTEDIPQGFANGDCTATGWRHNCVRHHAACPPGGHSHLRNWR